MYDDLNGPLWTWPTLCSALQLPTRSGPDVRGIAIDSRSLRPGDLFVALRAERDGHDFVPAALAAGAAGVLISREMDLRVPKLVVPDTLEALRTLAAVARARTRARVVAVTGSSGKTTLKTLLGHALLAHASAASFNNHLGVPLTLARMPKTASFAVIEIGTNHPGEIAPLALLAQPDVAVLLNVLPAHIGNFDGIEALRAEKLSIADGLARHGVFVLPAALRTHYTGDARVLTFGTEADADVRLATEVMDGVLQAVVRWHDGGAEHERRMPVPGGGEHRALSCAAACAVAIALGAGAHEMDEFVGRLGEGELPAGRGNRTMAAGIEVVDDSYNANPVSVGHALRDLARAPGRKVALLGDILELGEQEQALHAGIAEHCAGIDVVHCVGPRMAALHGRLPAAQRGEYLENPDDCTPERVAGWLRPGDTLLVKGSNLIFWQRRLVARLLERLAAGA